MKKIIIAIFAISLSTTLSAKKVKFAVDMTGIITSTLGVHVTGDFQVIAGYPLDWDPTSITLTQEGTTNIYSTVVTIPAFQKYEFRFVNGDQTYESEFVPDESRVGYNFNDNRWLYVDSLTNDTTFIGAIQFGMNAPAGLSLVRYKVDIKNALPVSSNGVHVGYNDNGYSSTKIRMYSFGDSIYEIINYYANNTYTFRYFNGNISTTTETVSGTCAVSGNRGLTLVKDTALEMVCFSSCSACVPLSVIELSNPISYFTLFPNPSKNNITFRSTNNELLETITINDVTGKQVKLISDVNQSIYYIVDLKLSSGIYTTTIANKNKEQQHIKLIIE